MTSDRLNFVQSSLYACQVVAANKEARKAGALLDSDADTFLKNECKADKWVIIELSQVTKMDTLILSQVCTVLSLVWILQKTCMVHDHLWPVHVLRW